MNALKEWAVVCRALEKGRQVVLLRKGGILEYKKGFEVKHHRFLMLPTFEHQSREYLQDDYVNELKDDLPIEGLSRMSIYAEAVDVREITDRTLLGKLAEFHVWNERYVNARMDYNPSKPMSVILLRVFKLDAPIEVRAQPEWAGCKSWVPLDIDVSDATPVLSDSEFEKVAEKYREVLSIAA